MMPIDEVYGAPNSEYDERVAQDQRNEERSRYAKTFKKNKKKRNMAKASRRRNRR